MSYATATSVSNWSNNRLRAFVIILPITAALLTRCSQLLCSSMVATVPISMYAESNCKAGLDWLARCELVSSHLVSSQAALQSLVCTVKHAHWAVCIRRRGPRAAADVFPESCDSACPIRIGVVSELNGRFKRRFYNDEHHRQWQLNDRSVDQSRLTFIMWVLTRSAFTIHCTKCM